MLLLLWGLGGCWALNRMDHRIQSELTKRIKSVGAVYENVSVEVSAQTATLRGTVLTPALRDTLPGLVAEFRFPEGWGSAFRPISEVISEVSLANAPKNLIPNSSPTRDELTSPVPDEGPVDLGRPAWLLVCASKGKVRLAGRVSSVEESAELANITRRFWKSAALTNLIKVDPATGPMRDRRKTLLGVPLSSLPDFEVAAVSRGDGRWTTLPLAADEFMICQALAGAEVEIASISMALNGWRPMAPPPVPSPGLALPKMATAPEVIKPKPLRSPPVLAPVARPIGPAHLGWAVNATDAVLFGAVRSEAAKAELLDAAERIFSPRVVSLSGVRVDANLPETKSTASLLPKSVDPSLPIGIAVAGATAKTFPATISDSDLAITYRELGLLQSDIRSGLHRFREALAKSGSLPLQPSYLLLVSNGSELHLSGEVATEQQRSMVLAIAQKLASGLTLRPNVTVTTRVTPDPTLVTALENSPPMHQGVPSVRSFRSGSAGRTGIIHSVPITASTRGSIDHERAARELELISRRFPSAKFEVAGHTDDLGTPATNAAASLKRAESLATYLQAATGMASSRFSVRGVGAEEPIADNSSDLGKARNRRIDVSILSYERK